VVCGLTSKRCYDRVKMVDPKQWGPYLWQSLHYIALGFPANPSMTDKMKYKQFFESLCNVIPCAKCCKNYHAHLKELPIDRFMSSPDQLFQWTVELHNIVNNDQGKPTWSVDKARAHYEKGGDRALCTPNYWKTAAIVLGLILLVIGGVWLWRRYRESPTTQEQPMSLLLKPSQVSQVFRNTQSVKR
jgi:hypothetical protein